MNLKNFLGDMMQAVDEICTWFEEEYTKVNELLSQSTVLFENKAGYYDVVYNENLHYEIVERCFMKVFLLWEQFLEKAFISYLCGSKDMKGMITKTFVTPLDEEHAYNILKGTKNYPDWTNIDTVNILSNLYFDNSGNFQYLKSPPEEMLDIKTIRNKLSHISQNSDNQYNRLLSKRIKRTDVRVGEFLLLFKNKSLTYYSHYCDFILDYVLAICNKPSFEDTPT